MATIACTVLSIIISCTSTSEVLRVTWNVTLVHYCSVQANYAGWLHTTAEIMPFIFVTFMSSNTAVNVLFRVTT